MSQRTFNRIRMIPCGDHNINFVGIFGTCYHHSIQVHMHNHRDNIVPAENNSSVVDDKLLFGNLVVDMLVDRNFLCYNSFSLLGVEEKLSNRQEEGRNKRVRREIST